MTLDDVLGSLADFDVTMPVFVETPDGELHELEEIAEDALNPGSLVLRIKAEVADV